MVEPTGGLWGSERALLDLCSGLAINHWDVAMCCPPHTAILDMADERFTKVYPTFIANLHRKSKLQRGLAAVRLLMASLRYQPNVIYVNQAGATRLTLLVARLISCPVVSHTRLAQDVDYLLPLLANPLLKQVLCVSKFIRNTFGSKSINEISPAIIVLLDCYVCRDVLTEVALDLKSMLLCVGRIEPNKGQDLLVLALHRVSRQLPKLQLRLLGTVVNEEFGTRLRSNIQVNGLQQRVAFEEFASDVWPHFQAADFLVCPSHVESLGRVIFEAWDAGIVPIAYRGSGGPAETISAANAGILYDRQDPDCLADAILAAYELSSEVRRGMVERGRAWMREHLDPRAYAQKVSDVFDAAIASSK